MIYTLSMAFLTESGEKTTFTLSDVREDVTSEEANALMDTLIANSIFENEKGDFMTKESVKLTQRESKDLGIA